MIPKVHPRFKLNGRSLDREGLMTVAYSYVKEGEPWEKEIGDFLLSWLDDFDVMTVRTSGSTGTPKDIKLKKQHMINSAANTNDWFNLPKECDVLCCLPISYIAGKMMVVRAIALGWQLDVVKPGSTPFHHLRKRYDFTALTNFQVLHSLDHIHKSRKIIIGGGPVSKNLPQLLEHKHTKAYHTYGMTETCTHVAIRKIHPVYQDFYTALNDITFSQDDRGCLVIHAPAITDDDVITNDIVELMDEKQFRILGRVGRVINTGGIKVHPENIEYKLSEHINARFFIHSVPHEQLGEAVVLAVEGDEHDIEIAIKGLQKFEIPKEVYFIKEFQETHTGKIDRTASLKHLKS